MTDKRKSLRLMLVAMLAMAIALLTGGRTHPRTLYHTTAQGSTNIHFSRPSGFYEEPFYLEIHVPSGEIYYTLDGSNPDKNSTRYTGPIYIGDASGQENVLSARTDISSWEVVVPTEPVDKCTVLRVRYYDVLGRSETCMESYFVGFSQKQGYEGYPVLSLIMDPKGLTDGETGIYIQGDTYDGNSWSGNYNQRGRDWERLAYFQYFRPEGELQTASSCGVRIKGNWSRRLPQKSLNLFARKQYSGQKEFMYDFWGDGYFPDVMTLHAGGNDTSGKLKNRLAAELCRETLETLRQEQASAMAAHYRRWYSITPEAFFDETEEYLAFFENRPRVIRQLLWQYDLLPKDTAP